MAARSSAALILVATLWSARAEALTFEEAMRLAALRPTASAPAAAAAARASTDGDSHGRVGNPEALLGLGPGTTSPGFSDLGVELQATLTVPIALHDVGGDRRRSVEAERASLAAEHRRRLLEHRRETARAWLALRSAENLLSIVAAEVTAARELADGLARAVAQGAAVAVDALEASLALEQQVARSIAAEGEVAEAASALALATGVSPLPRPTADGEVPTVTLPPASEWERWIALAQGLPEAQAFAWVSSAARLLAAEAEGAGGSWLTVGAQAQRNSSDQWQIYGLLGARWSAFERNQRSRSHALEGARMAEGEAASAAHRARVVLALALHDVAHERETEHAAASGVLPAAERLVAARELALQHGAGTVFDLLRARSVRLNASAEVVACEGRRRRAELDAWLLLSSLQRAGAGR